MHQTLDQFLARTLRGEISPWPSSGLDAEPDELVRRVSHHGIALMLASTGEGMACWPEEVRRQVLEEARTQQAWEISHHRVVASLLDRLAGAGLDCVIMKGTALAYAFYPEPAMRRRGDTDLLVRFDHLPAVREVLAAEGLVRAGDPHGLLYQEGWHHHTRFGTVHGIDLHWRTCDSAVLERALPTCEVLATAQPLARLSPGARVADPVLTFIHVALNRTSHQAHGYLVEGARVAGGDRLIWARDFDLLARSFDAGQWDRLAALAIARDLAPIIADAVEFAGSVFATPVPDRVLAVLRKGGGTSRVAQYLHEPMPLRRWLKDLQALPHWRQKVSLATSLVIPSATYLRRRYPDASRWPAALLYLRWLARNLSRAGSREPTL